MRPRLDAETIKRLVSHYGPSRTENILQGRDAKWNADVAAWQRLISLGASCKLLNETDSENGPGQRKPC